MRSGRVTAVVIWAATAALAQHAPHAAARPAAPKVKNGAGVVRGMKAPRPAVGAQIDRLEKMTPAERQRALEALPPDRRDAVETRLRRLQNLSPEQRAQLQERLQKFESLPPEQQKQVRQLARKLRELPDDRRPTVRRELESLRNMPEADRKSRMNSPEFKNSFSRDERDILRQSSSLLPDQL